MNLKDQNWKNFTDSHLYDWYGIWTRYTPQGNVKESFQSVRLFKSNPELTEIHQTNRYIYDSDNIKEESWSYNQQDNSLDDGMFHPSRSTIRGFFLKSGHAVWLSTQLQEGSYLGAELFFRNENLRHSVGIVYDELGNLFHTANIREDLRGFPSQYWSTDIEQLPERNLNGNWQGTSMTMTSDLNISTPVSTSLKWEWKGHKTFYLPDGVSISCPQKITFGTPFILVGNWLLNDAQMQQLMVKYGQSGNFSSLILQNLWL